MKVGGGEGDRTLDLRIANATLSQLSYSPFAGRGILAAKQGKPKSCENPHCAILRGAKLSGSPAPSSVPPANNSGAADWRGLCAAP